MDSVFATLWIDIVMAAVFGAFGGLGLGLLQEKGLEMPRLDREAGVSFVDLGFIADVLVGALAAIITYALNPPTGAPELVGATATAGIGGSGILKGYIKSTAAREQASQAEKYKAAAEAAKSGDDVSARLEELERLDERITARYGPK